MTKIHELLAKYDIPMPRDGADCPDAWIPAIEKLIQALLAIGWDKQCTRIWSRRGGLRFYMDNGTPEFGALILEAEEEVNAL